MSGFYLMHRDWQDADIFGNEEYSSRDAWVWLIENAAWKPTVARVKGVKVEIQRGQMTFSIRFLGEKWQWSKSRVDRFLKRLAADGMISTCSKIGTTSGHQAGQGQSIITICNYDRYQDVPVADRDSQQVKSGTTAGQQRDKEEQRNKLKKELEDEEEDAGEGEAELDLGGKPSGTKAVFDAWNAMAATCKARGADVLTDKRRAALRCRIDEYTETIVLEAIAAVPSKPWLMGENERKWTANFEWLLRPDSITRLREGMYDHGQQYRPANDHTRRDQYPSPATAILAARRRLGIDG